MRQHRAGLLVAATALAPALLLSTPAFAGPSVAPATVTSATVSSETPVDVMTEDELRAAITAILEAETTGRAVTEAATQALNGTVDDMRTFLKTGHRFAQAHGDRFALLVILGRARENGDRRVIQEINDLLDRDIPEEYREWLETGYPLAQAEDDRFALFVVLGKAQKAGDTKLVQEINGLLDRMDAEEVHTWLATYRAA
ncbi:ALF repeat-containing protein [Streptomyces sp. NPDC085937]|uniref:ALF repeat-containing protein n=1 Tax=Streptomyces sp. NPDC085937 TaxID=3365742 RepID=UPI0037D44861